MRNINESQYYKGDRGSMLIYGSYNNANRYSSCTVDKIVIIKIIDGEKTKEVLTDANSRYLYDCTSYYHSIVPEEYGLKPA